MPETEQGDVMLFGRRIPRQNERKFILIAGAAGIVGLLLIVFKSRAASSPADTSGQSSPPASGTGSSSAGAGSDVGGSGSGTSPTHPSVHFSFTESTSPSIEVEKGGSKSGSGGLNVFGLFSVGGGGQGSQTRHVKESVENVFSADVTLTDFTDNELQSLLAGLTGLAGTQEERASQAQQEINQAYPFIEPGHTIAGITATEASDQAVHQAQNETAILRQQAQQAYLQRLIGRYQVAIR